MYVYYLSLNHDFIIKCTGKKLNKKKKTFKYLFLYPIYYVKMQFSISSF